MKQNGIILKLVQTQISPEQDRDQIDKHFDIMPKTPLREDAFDVTDEEKINAISGYFKEIMQTLGLDLEDDSLKGTPKRVAKMFVKEIFSGLNPKNKPVNISFTNIFATRLG